MMDWNLEREHRLLEESQIRQLAITEATTDLVATIDVDGFLLTLNAAGHRMLNLAMGADLAHLRLGGFYNRRSAEQLLKVDVPAAIKHGVWHTEVSIREGKGPCIQASQVLVAHRNDHGNVEFFSVIIRDIRPLQAAETKRRQMLEQLHQAKKMETIGRLAGGIAHDFNNIITVIMGYAELGLLNKSIDPEHGEELKIILESAQKASRLTTQLLDFSSKNVIEPQVLNVNDVIRQSEQLVRSLMGEEIRLDFDLQPDLWHVEIDHSQLEQVILNLAVNARDALSGRGRFTVRTINRIFDHDQALLLGLAKAGEHVELTVSDTGTGISSEHLEHIFEPFFTTKSKGKGTGMGLSAVYSAIRQNRGCINVSSNPGKGTVFTICLPRTSPAPDVISPDAGKIVSRQLREGSETILLVEDNRNLRALLATILDDRGYKVLQAADGKAALDLYGMDSDLIDLVITDVVMPKLDGFELARRLQRKNPRLKVLLISGHTDQLVSLQNRETGTLRVLSKPFPTTRLVREVRSWLDTPLESSAIVA